MPWRMSLRAEMQMADSGDRFGGFDDDMVVFVGEFGFVTIADDSAVVADAAAAAGDRTAAAAVAVDTVLANGSRIDNGGQLLLHVRLVCVCDLGVRVIFRIFVNRMSDFSWM